MDVKKMTVSDFLEGSKKAFKIPIYQRNYSWGKDQCEKLFEDIKIIINNKFNIEHFMGTIVSYEDKDSNMNSKKYIIIDGQQRITTIVLLLKAIYEVIEDEYDKKEILNEYLSVNLKDEPDEHKLRLIEDDFKVYREILNNNISLYKNTDLVKNYILFTKLLKEFSPEDVYKAIKCLNIVHIEIEVDKENPQIIFESLNSTGVALNISDLIRNFLLMKLDYELQNDFYNNYWLEIEKYVHTDKMSSFITDYLTMKLGEKTNKKKIYDEFKRYVIINPLSNKEVLIDLKRYAKYYGYFINKNSENEQINVYLDEISILKTEKAFPVLLNIFDKYYGIEDEKVINLLKVIVSYLVRRKVCNLATNALTDVFTNICKNIKIADKAKDLCYITIDYLRKCVGKNRFPRDKEFKENFIKEKLYTKNNNEILNYLLRKINESMSKEKINISTNISIEHIMPQTLTEKWKNDLNSVDNNYEMTYEFLDTIGNLTLTAYNSELSNKEFEYKKSEYKRSNIMITREISEYEKWGINNIIARAEKLYENSCNIWSISNGYKEIHTLREYTNREYTDSEYDIFELGDITHHKIEYYKINNEKHIVKTFKDLYVDVCKYLYNIDKNKFIGISFVKNSNENMSKPKNIDTNIFIETGLNGNNTIKKVRFVLDYFDMRDIVTVKFIVPQKNMDNENR